MPTTTVHSGCGVESPNCSAGMTSKYANADGAAAPVPGTCRDSCALGGGLDNCGPSKTLIRVTPQVRMARSSGFAAEWQSLMATPAAQVPARQAQAIGRSSANPVRRVISRPAASASIVPPRASVPLMVHTCPLARVRFNEHDRPGVSPSAKIASPSGVLCSQASAWSPFDWASVMPAARTNVISSVMRAIMPLRTNVISSVMRAIMPLRGLGSVPAPLT